MDRGAFLFLSAPEAIIRNEENEDFEKIFTGWFFGVGS